MLHVASPRLRMETMSTSAVSRVFALFTIPYVWPDLPGTKEVYTVNTPVEKYSNDIQH